MDKYIHLADSNHIDHVIGILPQLFLVLPFIIGLIMYILSVIVSNRRYKKWPFYRTAFWVIGVISSVVVVAGPLSERTHIDFKAHMLGHLLLGMLAPLLMVLAAPMTLVMRTLNVTLARRLSRILQRWPVRILSDPVIAFLLNIGGLGVLYTTDMYAAMHQNIILHVWVHIHVFLAGYLFTTSIIYIDPTPHRSSFVYRAIVLIIALAGHGILSKYIYAHPPIGVPEIQAEIGGMLMYYGGDAIDIILISIFCYQWFSLTRPRTTLVKDVHP